jgi:hypothetical protein
VSPRLGVSAFVRLAGDGDTGSLEEFKQEKGRKGEKPKSF